MAFPKKFVVILICLCELSTITLCRPSKNNHASKFHQICFPGQKIKTVNGQCTCSEGGINIQCSSTTPNPQYQEAREEYDHIMKRFRDFLKESQNTRTFWEKEKERQEKEKELQKSIDDLRKITDITLNKDIPPSEIYEPKPNVDEPFHPVL